MKTVFRHILSFQRNHHFWMGRSWQYKNARRYIMAVAGLLLLALMIPVLSYAKDQNTSSAILGANDPRDDSNPWGVASGAEWFSDFPRFNPLLKAAGVRWLRGFYEWQIIQPRRGYFNWALTDRLVANAKANDIHLTYTFAYFAPWASADGGTRKFPIKDIQFWRDYVSGLVSRYRADIKYWEVWNEFNGSFAENGTPAIYAEMVREASIAAKKIDPTAQIGISVANFDVNFLDAAIRAGAGGHFDYICVHPYEKLGALADGGEVDFLTMTRTLRHWRKPSGAQASDFAMCFTPRSARASAPELFSIAASITDAPAAPQRADTSASTTTVRDAAAENADASRRSALARRSRSAHERA